MNKYRAVVYSRVSTSRDEQAESIENQIKLAENYLAKHPELELVKPVDYFSEVISAKSDIRPKYMELLDFIRSGAVDVLLVKDMKRLNRSTQNTYELFSLMEDLDFKILTLSDGRITDKSAFQESESMTLLGIEALFAENLVRVQSKYGKTVQRLRCENKKITPKDATLFGYYWDKSTGDVAIDQEKAQVIREIFDMYVFENKGAQEIRKYLSTIGYDYSLRTISKWLSEPKYVGDWVINKKSSKLGIGSGKKTIRYELPPEEWIHISRPDLAIVYSDIWEMAQKIRNNRTREYDGNNRIKKAARFKNNAHLFSGKLYCGSCGSSYTFRYADRANTVAIYRDSYAVKTKTPTEECSNKKFKRVYEEDIIQIAKVAINSVVNGASINVPLLLAILEELLQKDNSNKTVILRLQEQKKQLSNENEKILESFIYAGNDNAMREMLHQRLNSNKAKIDDIEENLLKLQEKKSVGSEISDRMTKIKEAILAWQREDIQITRTVVESFINRMYIHPDGLVEILLNIDNPPRLRYKLDEVNTKNNNDAKKENSETSSPFIMASNSVEYADVKAEYTRIAGLLEHDRTRQDIEFKYVKFKHKAVNDADMVIDVKVVVPIKGGEAE